MQQDTLFELDVDWHDLWRGMPEYEQKDLTPKSSVIVHFENDEDRERFAELVEQRISLKTQSVWYPETEIGHYADRRFLTPEPVVPRYPIYVISKGRWKSRKTVKALDKIGLDYHVVIEPQEYDEYATVIDPSRLLVLPFSNLGQGSIPARNWVWEHSIEAGVARHWILDDNIGGFYRLYKNLKTPVRTGAIFRTIETFCDRYENVGISGMNYFMFAPRKTIIPPLYLNTRIYSCILIQNNIPFRWRGRYNEDTDLSIRVLKSGLCTVLFNAFLAHKEATMTMPGGNTDELYAGDGRLKMAESLRDQHPDIVSVTDKWGRKQHHVDYRRFACNRLIPKEGVEIPEGIDNFGMYLDVDEESET